MNYICIDRGSERCPCHLIEAGQCYTCTMTRSGICSCEDAAGWLGVCPYSEYLHQGASVLNCPEDFPSPYYVLSKIDYSHDFAVVRLAVPGGTAQRCRRPGAYIMAQALGWRIPLSILRVGVDSEARSSWVEILIKEEGPKSRALLAETEKWMAAGPYYNGLLGREEMDEIPAFIIARGSGVAPLVHMLDCSVERSVNQSCIKRTLYIDDEVIPEEFMEEYLRGHVFQRIRLSDPETLEKLRCEAEGHQTAAFLVSPYYIKQLTAGMDQEKISRITVPNPANLCCGMGICGACSHTDQDGVTVRLCKCSETVLE